MKVVVLGGGNSPEREVSLRSAKAVAEAVRQNDYEVVEIDPANDLNLLDDIPSDCVVLPILHGAGGEDGEIQAELEKRHLKYLGSDSKSSAVCFDKWQTRQQLEKAGIKMPQGALVNRHTYHDHPIAKKPHVLKVNRGGSSIGTLIIRQNNQAGPAQVNKIFELDQNAVLEQLIEGTEITIPILDREALPVIEIRPPEGLEFDYENKYNGASAEICPPESISQETQQQAQAIAEKVHQVMNCRHLSRVDIMLDKDNKPYVLEINTIPGLTNQSLYPKSAAVAGLTMPELVKKFIDLAGQ